MGEEGKGKEMERKKGEGRKGRFGEPFYLPLLYHDLDIYQVLANYGPWVKFNL